MTSSSDSLQIDAVGIPRDKKGLIGMTSCPGKNGRDLLADLKVVRDWGAHALVSLIEDQEFELLGVKELPDLCQQLGLAWYHLPIRDFGVPDERFEEQWKHTGTELRRILSEGGKVVLHCRGGLGRTGMIAAKLLMEFGLAPEEAITRIRKARPGTIETEVQAEYLLQWH